MTSLQSLIKISKDPSDSTRGSAFKDVLDSLQGSRPINLSSLYDLPHNDFKLVVEALHEWRLQRYLYSSSAAAGRQDA